jgi:hypothetical protein
MDGVIAKRAEYLGKADECLRRAANTRNENLREDFLCRELHSAAFCRIAKPGDWIRIVLFSVIELARNA